MTCFLSAFSDQPCSGRLVRCHLIPKQQIRRAVMSKWPRGWPVDKVQRDYLQRKLDDPRGWVFGCGGAMGPGGHHGLLDQSRTLKIPRSALPEGLEEFAEELGLGYWLEREYGPLQEAA